MARTIGSGSVQIGANEVTQVAQIELDESVDLVDATTLDDEGWAYSIPGLKSIKGRLTLIVGGTNAPAPGSTGTATIMIGTKTYTGTIVFGAGSYRVAPDQVLQYVVEFASQGAWTVS